MATVDPFDSRELDEASGRDAATRDGVGWRGAGCCRARSDCSSRRRWPSRPCWLRRRHRDRRSARLGRRPGGVDDGARTRRTARTPTQIVALEAYGGRIAVISAASGKIVRVLAATNGFGTPTLAVTPDGAAVYFGSGHLPARKECPSPRKRLCRRDRPSSHPRWTRHDGRARRLPGGQSGRTTACLHPRP